jgi:phytoene/squalene synthetase
LWCALADADRGISNELIDRVAYRGGTQKTIRDTLDWAAAAAKVTLEPAGAALKRVAKAQGLDSKKLREFRKNIQRGHAPLRAQKYYGWCLEDLADPKGAKRRRIQRELADTTESDFASLLALIAELRKG